ncbi:CatB-related O-acetyltransferase [Phenylobacterium sp.]|uniref:CatB-related O-acetyltransferase n=1 Tax=Phenylobacterium sp. TaxID=1871053 RepID=UPI00286E0BF3|nr:CatB-related O-acetyltransferase [Phenylobacterium sp.]
MPHTVERTQLVGASAVSIGRFTYGTEHVSARQWGEGATLRIGSFCSFASSVIIFLGGNHRSDWATTFPFGHAYPEQLGGSEIVGHPHTNGDVTIGDDVWVAHGVTIMSGVTIGSGAVLAVNATVIKDVAPYQIVGGNPAKPIRQRFSDEVVALLLELRWWELPVEVITAIAPDLSRPPEAAALKDLIRRVRS